MTWTVRPCPSPGELSELLAAGIPYPVACLLYQRGVRTAEEAQVYLDPKRIPLPHPDALPDARVAAERVAAAVARGERVAVYGDYDPDGCTSLAQMVLALQRLGVPRERIVVRVPDHDREGYGLHRHAVEELSAAGCTLLVALDCGVTAVDEVARARELGMDVVVIDHHEPGARLPDAVAVVDPKRNDRPWPGRELAASGLTHVFLWGLFMAMGRQDPEDRAFLNGLVDLAGLGTIADMVPLVGPNRRLAALGLEKLNRSPRTSLAELVRQCGLTGRRITSYDVAMRLAPKLNAGRRMGHSSIAPRLLLEEDAERAAELAGLLVSLNSARRSETERAYQEARAQVDAGRRAIVVAGAWRKGVVGLVAQKLVLEFHRPAFAIALDGEAGTGSCRSVEGVHVTHLLARCADLLHRWGGHEAAGGFTIPSAHIEAFRERLELLLQEYPESLFTPRVEADIRVRAEDLPQLAQWLPLLEPFGTGNPHPRVVVRCAVEGSRVLGGKHLEVLVPGAPGRPLSIVGWGMAGTEVAAREAELLLEWDGSALRLRDLRAA